MKVQALRGDPEFRVQEFSLLLQRAEVRAVAAGTSCFAIRNLQFAICIMALFFPGCAPPTVSAVPAASVAANASSPPETAPIPRPPVKKVARAVAEIDRVLIISIDGLRPDLALRAYMPRVRALCASGSYTFWAETAAEAYTLPCHVSMLTGVSSDKHGVTWNDYIEEAYPMSATLFELAHEVGYTTALASGKMKFVTLLKPLEGDQTSRGNPTQGVQTLDEAAPKTRPQPQVRSPKSQDRIIDRQSPTSNTNQLVFQRASFRASNTVDHYYIPATEPVTDNEVAAEAVRILREHRPEVFFVHFPGVDTVGHEHGWGSLQQVAAIEKVDAAVGQVLDELTEADLTESTLIILTADHGGAGLDHNAGDARAHFIPWIVSGAGIRRDYDLTLVERTIHIEDTFATACAFLGIDSGKHGNESPMSSVLTDKDLSDADRAESVLAP